MRKRKHWQLDFLPRLIVVTSLFALVFGKKYYEQNTESNRSATVRRTKYKRCNDHNGCNIGDIEKSTANQKMSLLK